MSSISVQLRDVRNVESVVDALQQAMDMAVNRSSVPELLRAGGRRDIHVYGLRPQTPAVASVSFEVHHRAHQGIVIMLAIEGPRQGLPTIPVSLIGRLRIGLEGTTQQVIPGLSSDRHGRVRYDAVLRLVREEISNRPRARVFAV